jgi:tetratricopeptide (TPR) repeat protein
MVVAVILCCGALAWAGARPKEELKPIAAAEAERRTNETRDAVIDLLAEGIDAHWHVGEWEACLRLLRQSIELDAHFVDAYTDLAWTLSNLNRDAEAVAVYQEGIEQNPDAADIYQQFGLFYHRRHKYNEAVEQFRKAIEKGAPRAWQHMLPSTLELAGRKREALAEWRALLKRFPGDEVAKRRLARLEEELKQEVGSD